jgi:hypothetical protein
LEVPTCTAKSPTRLKQRDRPLAGKVGTVGEKCPVILPTNGDFHRRLCFPSEGRHAEDFFALKNPTASAGFEPANLVTRGQRANP